MFSKGIQKTSSKKYTLMPWKSPGQIFILRCLLIFFFTFMLAPLAIASESELDEITKALKEKNARWTAKETPISKLTAEEKRRRLGRGIQFSQAFGNILPIPYASPPAALDWRDYAGGNYVTPVKDQGVCGACWAFATTSTLESSILISQNTPGIALDLSEQTLLSCSGAGTCIGGYIDIASDFVRDFGIPSESCFSYLAYEGACINTCFGSQENTYRINDWFRVNPSLNDIKNAIYQYGPLLTTMMVYTDFFYYHSGIYSYSWGGSEGYHAATIVGYDDAEQYFIVKSSLGAEWGESGYFRIAYSEMANPVYFGYWTIAYENTIPADFPIIDGITRNNTEKPDTKGQDNGEDKSKGVSRLYGTVRDNSGSPLTGVEVKVGKYSVTTDWSGHYSFPEVPSGNHTVILRKEGYPVTSENISLLPDTTVTKDFILFQNGRQDQDATDDPSSNNPDPNAGQHGGILGPGWHMVNGSPVTPKDADAYYATKRRENAAKPLSMPFLAAAGTNITPELAELARALRYDPKLIYDYVHNHIDYAPYFASLKGATLTYLDGSGNDTDQASLMIALLRISGYSAQYIYGDMTIPGAQMANWLGVDQNETVIWSVLSSAGIPVTYVQTNGTAIFRRVWVKATINGTDYLFDPAFKTYTYTNKIDLGQAMGYNQSDFMNAAGSGATITADYVQNLNETNIRNMLSTYASNLVNAIRSQYPNHDIKEIIGGRSIVQSNLTDYTTTLPFSPVVTYTWDNVPTEYTAKLKITHESSTHVVDINDYIIDVPDLDGQRITLTYAGADNHPELRVNGALKASGSATTAGSTCYLTVTVDHPYTGTYGDQTARYTIKSGSTYAVVYNFGGASDMHLQKQQKQLDDYRAQGLADTTEDVRGETLNIMGLTWLKEVLLGDRLLAALAENIVIRHHMIGLMAQESAYYIDVRNSLVSIISRHNLEADEKVQFKASSLMASAFEHGILEQLMGSDKPGVSTMKLFQIANAASRKVFYVNHDNYCPNITDINNFIAANCQGIASQLSGYSSSTLRIFFANVNLTYGSVYVYKIILPESGDLQLGHWQGEGYIRKYEDTGYLSMEMTIGSDGYFGGYSSENNVYVQPPLISQATQTNLTANSNNATITRQVTPPSIAASTSRDPVDMAGGSYLYDHTDLALGGDAPMGLSFSRSYDSSLNRTKRSLGYGWTHNYDIYITPTSHGDPGLGMRQPVDAASLIAALYVSIDLIKTQDNIQGWMAASLASKWAVDKVIDNAITVHLGKKTMEFIKLADGSYAQPQGITTQLIKNGDGTYSLLERFGTRIDFNTNKQIAQLRDVDGNTMTFTYSGTDLSTIRDAFGRTLTLQYSGGLINRVTDSAGRYVTYAYDTAQNLTTYTDAEAKAWGYGYNADHRMTSLSNPLNITTATNTYDSLGRVNTQTVPRQGGGTVTYNFYFSGFRNVEENPAGNTTTYYYDEKGREYAVQNALGHKGTKQFDGQNHLVLSTDPRLNSTSYSYDGNQNLIGTTNALTQSTAYVYDAQFRRTDTVDSVYHGTHVDYDAEHHPTVSKYGVQYAANFLPTDNGISQTSAAYYANGLPQTATDGRSTATSFTYDGYGNPDTTKVSVHPVIDYTYDAVGRMTALKDQVNSTTSFIYDKRNLLMTKVDPLGRPTSFAYDDAGRLDYVIDRNNSMIDYSYTPTSKVDTITYPDASTVHFTYNQHDDLTGMQDSIGNTNYTYDAVHRLSTQTDANGFAVGYAYDENGNLKELTYPGNKKVIYTYDELNRLKTVKIDWLNQTATYYYDDAGRLDYVVNFNGTITDYGYDNANRLTSLENKKSDTSIIASYGFTLDGNGNRTQVVQNEPLTLTPLTDTVSYTYNTTKNRLLTAGSNAFGYDNEGQLNSGYGNSYAFDYEHRLTNIGSAYQFYYDGAGNRLKTVRSGVTTKYIYDAGGNLLAEADVNNVITRYYIYGAGLMGMVTPSDQVYCYQYNAVGSTIAITDQSQNMVNKYSYDSFGNILSQQEAVSQPFKFVGQFGVMTEPNGFYYMRARYYDPNVGRFVSEDPIGFEGGINLFVYASNNPLMFIDPSGLFDYEQLLKNTRDYSGVAAWGTALSGFEPAALVFGAIALGAEALRVGFYSKTPVIDTATMGVKVITKVNDPSLNQFKDKAIDVSVDYFKSSNNKSNISPYGTPSYNPVLRCHGK